MSIMGRRQREAERQRAIHELEYLLFRRRVLLREADMHKVELQKCKDELAQLQANPETGSTDIIFAKISVNKCLTLINHSENNLNNLSVKIQQAEEKCKAMGIELSDKEM